MRIDFQGPFQVLINKARSGTAPDVDEIMQVLHSNPSFADTRFVDFALSLVENPEGIDRITYYLYEGNQIQRNYACLYLNRKGEWELVKEAFMAGLIDEIQAYSR